ncbi:MAG: PBECR2 nuclease fold domain-containing protein [Magnetospiraceae bacterium]
MATVSPFGLEPEDSIQFFRKKGFALGFDWRDVWKKEHAVAFTVAKAMRLDILEDIRAAVDAAIKNGITFSEFQKGLEPILKAKGWWGKGMAFDPKTKTLKRAQLGSPRRLRVIYDTNLRMAHAAGRWQRIAAVADRRPWLVYITAGDSRVRPAHRRWHYVVRRWDDPFWDTHYPPNGWFCRCIILQLSDRDLARLGLTESPPPVIDLEPRLNTRRGKMDFVPQGIDTGFDYNVGKARLRAFTPPPDGGLPTSFPSDIPLPPLPPARPAAASRLLPDNLPDEDYMDAFLAAFGAVRGKPVIFTDVAGEDLVVSEGLFHEKDKAGNLLFSKVKKFGRHPYMRLIAETLKDPDEIWWVWEEDTDTPGVYHLKRRFIGRWQLPNQQVPGLAVFEHHPRTGWRAATAFAPNARKSLNKQSKSLEKVRGGTLAYRRK